MKKISKKKPVKKVKKPARAPKSSKPAAVKAKAAKTTSRKTTSSDLVNILFREMEQEAKTTRKFLQRLPEDKYDWKPHDKSMTMQRLATHIAELPSWVTMAINTNELDFKNNSYVPKMIKSNDALMELLEKSLEEAKESFANTSDEKLSGVWVMRNGDTVLSRSTKGEVIRMAFSQIIHHRAQLGVYLRLLEVPIPGSYGPSADDQSF